MTNTLPSLKETIARHGLRADKRFGQHFLLDGNITDKIVRLAGDLGGVHVIEVGPGPGGLTRAILKGYGAGDTGHGIASLTLIEMDARAIPILEELAAYGAIPVRIIRGDALKVNLVEEVSSPRAIIANLPYNAGTEMLIGWLHEIAADAGSYQSLTLMFQKEVAGRLTAAPGSKAYGRLSVLAQWLCEVVPLFTLPPAAFTPPPRVESAVVRLVPRVNRESADIKRLEKVTAAAFGQRRKMLRSSLKTLGTDAEALLEQAGIDPTLRAENLTVQQFIKLSGLYSGN